MNNVIDYYCCILATTKVKDLNLTVSRAWRWYILINDHRLYKHTHLIWSHVLRFVSLFYLRLAIQKSFRGAHTHAFYAWNCVDFNICAMQINISHLQRRMRASKRRKKTKYDVATINRSKAFEKEHENILVAAAVWCRFKKFIFDECESTAV